MYFAHFTVSGVSAPLLCDSVFASRCGKHNAAMIAHAFQKAQNAAKSKHSFSLSLSLSISLPPLPLPQSALSPPPQLPAKVFSSHDCKHA